MRSASAGPRHHRVMGPLIATMLASVGALAPTAAAANPPNVEPDWVRVSYDDLGEPTDDISGDWYLSPDAQLAVEHTSADEFKTVDLSTRLVVSTFALPDLASVRWSHDGEVIYGFTDNAGEAGQFRQLIVADPVSATFTSTPLVEATTAVSEPRVSDVLPGGKRRVTWLEKDDGFGVVSMTVRTATTDGANEHVLGAVNSTSGNADLTPDGRYALVHEGADRNVDREVPDKLTRFDTTTGASVRADSEYPTANDQTWYADGARLSVDGTQVAWSVGNFQVWVRRLGDPAGRAYNDVHSLGLGRPWGFSDDGTKLTVGSGGGGYGGGWVVDLATGQYSQQTANAATYANENEPPSYSGVEVVSVGYRVGRFLVDPRVGDDDGGLWLTAPVGMSGPVTLSATAIRPGGTIDFNTSGFDGVFYGWSNLRGEFTQLGENSFRWTHDPTDMWTGARLSVEGDDRFPHEYFVPILPEPTPTDAAVTVQGNTVTVAYSPDQAHNDHALSWTLSCAGLSTSSPFAANGSGSLSLTDVPAGTHQCSVYGTDILGAGAARTYTAQVVSPTVPPTVPPTAPPTVPPTVPPTPLPALSAPATKAKVAAGKVTLTFAAAATGTTTVVRYATGKKFPQSAKAGKRLYAGTGSKVTKKLPKGTYKVAVFTVSADGRVSTPKKLTVRIR